MLELLPRRGSRRAPAAGGGEASRMFSPLRQAFTVLVVDDNYSKRYAVSRALRAHGFRVIEAAHATEALAVPACSALVLDVHLPDMDGFALCRRLRELHPSRPIVQISSVLMEHEYQQAGREAGADAYLPDPGPDELVSTLDRLLQEKSALQ